MLSERLPGGIVVKNPPANAGDARDTGLILGLKISPGEEMASHSKYSCMETFGDRRAWQATVHGSAKNQT